MNHQYFFLRFLYLLIFQEVSWISNKFFRLNSPSQFLTDEYNNLQTIFLLDVFLPIILSADLFQFLGFIKSICFMYYCTIPQTIPNSNPIVPLLIVLMRWYRGIENTIIHKRAWSFVHGLLTKHTTMYATTRSIFLISLIENRRGRNCCKQHHLVPLVVSSMPHSGWKMGKNYSIK